VKLEIVIHEERLINTEGMFPNYAIPGSAAIDLRACRIDGKPMTSKINLYPGHKVKIGAGFAVHLQHEDFADNEYQVKLASMIIPRSGLGSKGIRLSNVLGLIDSDFQGEIIMAIENTGDEVFILEPMDRIAQMAIVSVFTPGFEVVEQFSQDTARGAGGFGSTGFA